MSKAVPLYPHAVSDALRLRLADFDDPFTGNHLAVREIGHDPVEDDDDSHVSDGGIDYDATSSVTPWKKLTFRLTVTLPEQELERVLPDTSSVDTDTVLTVLMACPSTRFRHGVRLRRTKGGAWTGYATIQRDDVKSLLSLRPQLVRTTSIPSDEDLPFATQAGTVVAVGEAVTLYVDVQPKLALNATVLMLWEDFANSEDHWRREHPDDVYHLEPFAEPRLWLNSRYGPLRDVLESTAKRGPEAALRDMTATLIAQPVMLQLSLAALTSLDVDEDSGSVILPTGWRGDLLASVLPRLYAEEPGEDERARRAAHEIREAEGAASLTARLGTVVQEMIVSYKSIESAVRTFESMREREGFGDE